MRLNICFTRKCTKQQKGAIKALFTPDLYSILHYVLDHPTAKKVASRSGIHWFHFQEFVTIVCWPSRLWYKVYSTAAADVRRSFHARVSSHPLAFWWARYVISRHFSYKLRLAVSALEHLILSLLIIDTKCYVYVNIGLDVYWQKILALPWTSWNDTF